MGPKARRVAAALASLVMSAGAAAATYPARPLRIIVPTSPSGGTDFITRVLATRLAERVGQSVVVDNRPGATGLIGLELAARATPDGYTLTLINVGLMIGAEQAGKLSFARGRDFTPVALSANSALMLATHLGVPAKSARELVDLARAQPGRLNYASTGAGGVPHLSTELFRHQNAMALTHVPYKGSGPALTDVLSGQVQIILTSAAALIPQVQAGRLRGLAVTGAKRIRTVPDVPTFAEAGFPRYEVSVWYGVFAPARTPVPVVSALNAELDRIVATPDIAERLSGAGFDPAGGTPAQFAAHLEREVAKWHEALKAAGMR